MRGIILKNEGSWFVVPEDLVGTFQSLSDQLYITEEYTDKWYAIAGQFDSEFLKYGIDSPEGLETTGREW